MSDMSHSIPSWLKVEHAENHLLLTLHITALNETEGNSLKTCLEDQMASDSIMQLTGVALDLAQVNLITSPAIGNLIFIHKRLAAQGQALVLPNPAPMLIQTLEFLKLDQILTVCRNPEEMRQALGG